MNASLGLGEGITFLHLDSNRNPRFAVGTLAGRFVLFCVIRDLNDLGVRAALDAFEAASDNHPARILAIVAADPKSKDDAQLQRIAATKLILWDLDSSALAAWRLDVKAPGLWLLLDPTLRAAGFWPIAQVNDALGVLEATPPPDAHAGVPIHAPVLIAPRIFEPAFCHDLIALYEKQGGTPSGTTRENLEGVTYVGLDETFKRRTDYTIAEKDVREAAMQRIYWRLLPEIQKAFSFRVTRMERYIVCCYDADPGGFFRPHRDNTTKGTAHRRFAVTINLNAEDYEGGDLRFPEFGSRTYRAPTGGAIVFSCSLLHEALPVTKGKRYAFLPFLYDEEGAKTRLDNNKYLDDSIGAYKH